MRELQLILLVLCQPSFLHLAAHIKGGPLSFTKNENEHMDINLNKVIGGIITTENGFRDGLAEHYGGNVISGRCSSYGES